MTELNSYGKRKEMNQPKEAMNDGVDPKNKGIAATALRVCCKAVLCITKFAVYGVLAVAFWWFFVAFGYSIFGEYWNRMVDSATYFNTR